MNFVDIWGHKQINRRVVEDICFSTFKKLGLWYKVSSGEWFVSTDENLLMLFVYYGGKRIGKVIEDGLLIGQIQIDYHNQKVKWLDYSIFDNEYIEFKTLDVEHNSPNSYLDKVVELITNVKEADTHICCYCGIRKPKNEIRFSCFDPKLTCYDCIDKVIEK